MKYSGQSLVLKTILQRQCLIFSNGVSKSISLEAGQSMPAFYQVFQVGTYEMSLSVKDSQNASTTQKAKFLIENQDQYSGKISCTIFEGASSCTFKALSPQAIINKISIDWGDGSNLGIIKISERFKNNKA